MKLLSPAKVNLCLRVSGKRKDGYHEIQTIFERISLCDRIQLRAAPSGIQLESDSKEIPLGPENLAYKAARLLKERFKVSRGVVIRLQKNIPVSAGLGGGSSNAAAVLWGLNRLWRLGLSQKKLLKLGAELGSDVPFFVLDTSFALGLGRGEILRKIPAPGVRLWHCVVKPPFGISTKEAYNDLRPLGLTPKKTDVKILLQSIQKGSSRGIGKLLINSLEVSVNKRVKVIHRIKKSLLGHGALGALMSGSGSAVFGLFDSKKAAGHAARALKKNKRWRVFVVSTY